MPNYGFRRFVVLGSVHLLIGIHIAHWKITGRSLAPLELNEVAYTLHQGMITAGFIFMGVALVSTLIAGRFFCSWGCHILALQDLSAWLLLKINIHPKPIRSRVLAWAPILAMFNLFIYPLAKRLKEGKGWPDFHIVTDLQGWSSFVSNNLWRNLPGPGITFITLVVCGFFIVYILGTRSFCHYACPYGALFSAADRLAPGRIILSGNCTQCGLCTAKCQSDIVVHEEIGRYKKVVSSACLKDLDCISACPEQAISFGYTQPPLFNKREKIKREYSFTRVEDFTMGGLFLINLYIFRGLYEIIPFLLAIAISTIFAYCFIFEYRLITEKSTRFFSAICLKSKGKYTFAGKVVLLFGLIILFFVLHSAFIRWHSDSGVQQYLSVKTYVENSTTEHLPTPITRKASEALVHFEKISKWGLYTPASIHRQLASLYNLEKNYSLAVNHLNEVLVQSPEDIEALFRLGNSYTRWGKREDANKTFRDLIINYGNCNSKQDSSIFTAACLLLGDNMSSAKKYGSSILCYKAALSMDASNYITWLAYGSTAAKCKLLTLAESCLKNSLKINPACAAAHFNLGVVYSKLNRTNDAISHYSRSAKLNPHKADAFCELGVLYYKQHNFCEAEIALKSAIKIDPSSKRANTFLAKLDKKNP
ncbi:MAG: tetratricopeptide repeat protein [Bacteroidia bacterium]|nr:tetratricopeptide repeat protein [Bacteroidia bacterium]